MADNLGSEKLEPSTNELEGEVTLYTLRHFKGHLLPPEFKNLVIAPFLNSLRYGNDLFKLVDKEAYYANYAVYVEGLLKRPGATVSLAQLDDGTVLGWCLSEPKLLHYVWVKKEVRRLGIAKALLPKEFERISHVTNKGISMWTAKFPDVRFDPWS